MKSERWQQIKTLFDRILEAPPAEREALLDRASAGDDELRCEIESLLASYDEAPGFMEKPAVATGAFIDPAVSDPDLSLDPLTEPDGSTADRIGRTIGPYRLIEELGQGGMGAVYLAERADGQFEQRVAVKFVRAGMGTDEILRRFRAERRILAALDHPHIARLYDGGVTDDGVPYIVMEHVEGAPIDEHCDALRLDVEARIDLFRTVCAAVQYAHQNLVVHRDIKPSNILVTPDGIAKLLDFGIAKLLEDPTSPVRPALTRTGMRIMTPEYASPEQVRGESITTASDVYALGVLLYELLAGHPPYHVRTGSPAEIERTICETEPLRPSVAASMGEETRSRPDNADRPDGTDEHDTARQPSPAAVARARSTEPERLRRRLAGDLDTIVLKALQKSPARRYESVGQLSEDLRRHRIGMPVVARPDTFAYLASKFVRRHRVGVAATIAVVTALSAGLAGTAWQARVASSERDRARRETIKAERTNLFLREMLASPDPNRDGRTVTVVEILDDAARRVDAELADQPEVAASLHATLANTYRGLGQYEDAESHARAALELEQRRARDRRARGGESHELARAHHGLGRVFHEQGRYEEAATNLGRAVELYGSVAGTDSLDLAEGLDALAVTLNNLGHDDEAERLYRDALRLYRRHLPPSDLRVARVLNNLAVVLGNREQFDEADPLHREALEIMRESYGGDHPEVAATLYNLAGVLDAQGRHDEARTVFEESLVMRRAVLGVEHPHVILTMISLANTLRAMHDHAGAERQVRAAVDLAASRLPANHPLTAYARLVLGQILCDGGRPTAAEEHLREALRIRSAVLPPGHWLLANTESVLGGCLAALGRRTEAESLLLDALTRLEEDRGPQHEKTRDTLRRLVDLYTAWGRSGEAERFSHRLVVTQESIVAPTGGAARESTDEPTRESSPAGAH